MGRSKGQVWLVDMGMVAGCKDLVKDSWGRTTLCPAERWALSYPPEMAFVGELDSETNAVLHHPPYRTK